MRKGEIVSDVLQAIVAGARRSAEARAEALPLDRVDAGASERSPRGDAFRASLAAGGVRVIAECKRRSPSKGILRESYDPVAIAKSYERAGAAGISVLTEPSFFDGAMAHLESVRRAVETPLLRKDFVVTEYQVAEARAIGADAVLLIVAALGAAELKRLIAAAERRGLLPIVEAHAADEIRTALDAGARTIGVNSRNLKTLEVDTAAFAHLADLIPDDAVAIAESGLRSGGDIRRLRDEGYDAFLVGERFMTQPDPGAALSELMAEAAGTGEARS
jgi:indole-3-glycerol phosphate synthase